MAPNKKVAFSAADQMIFQKQKLDFSITKPCKFELEAAVFNQEQLLYTQSGLISRGPISITTKISGFFKQ